MRIWALLCCLSAEGHEITFLGFTDGDHVDGQDAQLRDMCKSIDFIPQALESLSSSKNYAARVQGLFSSLPYAVLRFRSNEMKKRISALLRSDNIDAILCVEPYQLVNLPPLTVPVILDNHNVEHVIFQRYARVERNPVKKFYAWLEGRRLREFERAACQRATVCMACSAQDRDLLQRLAPNSDFVVAPNVVDSNQYVPADEGDGLTILHQGQLDWYPNRDAVEFFISKIFPLIRSQVPGIRFVVAGRNMSDQLRRRWDRVPGVELVGSVPDMRPQIASATVCVVPLRIGSGTRLKILEAAAMGKAIVSTRIGSEGLAFADGKEIVLAENPPDFAKAVVDLITNPVRRKALGQAARRRVERQYNFATFQSALRNALAILRTTTPAIAGVATVCGQEAAR